jgi:hypothetical protein
MKRNVIVTLSDMMHRYFQFLKRLCQGAEFIRTDTITRRIREDDL